MESLHPRKWCATIKCHTEDNVKEKLLEGFRNEEEFGYMTGYEPWEKLIFDR